MSNSVEIVQALVSPCEKLIDAVQTAIGKAYEPRYVKKMADAKAHEIAVIGNAIRESCDIPISYDKNNISMATTDWEQFVNRTQSRLAFQELKKQENIEAVIGQAYHALESEASVSSTPIDPDWMSRFFNSVENVSTEEMRRFWSKILVGETKSPGVVSMRTLAVVQNMSKDEALLFEKILPFVLEARQNDYFLFRDIRILRKNDVSLRDILILQECGLVMANNDVAASFSASENEEELMRSFRTKKYIVRLSTPEEERQHIAVPGYPLTNTGIELANILCVPSDENYIFDAAQKIAQKAGVVATVHKFYGRSGLEVFFDSDVLAKYSG